MPIVRLSEGQLTPLNRPDWCTLTKVGTFFIPADGGEFDLHFHDCDEYWLINSGRARVVTEGVEFDVGPGDVVCTQAGEEHDIIAIYEDLHGFFLEQELVGEQRVGHLHRRPENAVKHPVPFLPAPGGGG